MKKWDEIGTNQIITDLQQLSAKHEAIKLDMLKLLDEMEEVEKDFNDGNIVLNKRLKNVKV